ncbi:MAG: DUF748 domain-containing protein [Candidatus Omnitrophica bacterium]|nr:DUF748 domain-containing protein [Candidatus Omnitrophota bacterium]
MIKKIILSVITISVILVAAIFIYRYQILQYSAERFIKSLLPNYVTIEGLSFEPHDNKISVKGFKILNPPDFSNIYLLEIDTISCKYRLRGKTLFDGFEVTEPIFKDAVLNIERLGDGKINLNEMKQFIEKSSGSVAPSGKKVPAKASSTLAGTKKLPDLVKLPEVFNVKNGKLVFIDRHVKPKTHLISFEGVEAAISLKLNDTYTQMLNLSSTGQGFLNGGQKETIRWTVSLNPQTPKLTMSNRFEVSSVNMLTFEPYYDKYSPLVFKKGTFSGTLIFDFDNGSIGSTNEVHLSDLLFYVKRDHENSEFWGTSVKDLAKYFASPFGDIVFDFKIKGDMSNPQFYLGPISKQALASMAIDKVSSLIENASKSQQPGQNGAKSDIEKAGEYIEMFKEMIKKK